jgi:hypothetical protein
MQPSSSHHADDDRQTDRGCAVVQLVEEREKEGRTMKAKPIAPTAQMSLGEKFARDFTIKTVAALKSAGRLAAHPERASVDLLASSLDEFIRVGLGAQDAVDRILAENERRSRGSNPASWAADKRARRRGR